MDRREWMGSVLATSVAAGLTEAAPKNTSDKEIAADGRYPVVPLERESIRIGLVQTRFRSIDPDNVERSRKENLAYMLDWIDRAQQDSHHDVLMFHELPLTGLSMTWNRATILKGCIEIPGVETEAIAQKAQQHRCYVIFGAYVVDRAWPGHFVSATTMIGPDGRIVDSQWKARNIMGALGGIELMTTTIFNVLDRYVEMYGWDRVLPVARTPIGNIALSSVQLEPELFRAFGMKGAEIVLRTATGRYRMADMQGAPLHNGFWSAVVNNASLPDDPQGLRRYWADGDWRKPTADSTNVLTTAFDARGNIVAQASDPTEQVVSFTIPIAAHRATARQPVVHAELYRRSFDAYVGRYPPGAFLRRQPSTVEEAAAMIKAGERWRR
jgi:predicted amidohydrolase